ncbi:MULTISPECIES: ABC transporter permease [Rhizobium/Agrobacterium group]|uniref:ABC transporter permease n=1 Tax=Rhizobium/Agrobacterium group TaxID=227290 RepID=UPI00107FC514|nr:MULTISPECIES: ABC transporter permease [Rhizobium/Agrobacterium group]MBB4401432.1 putative hydroxymethylpyrimidine transport system permease protein [Agrobacterium radiobacter]MBB5587961.1 putative hydroxymethylpyrimidine transport system permease protein [Agrobacterium radiobacter]TGE90598.1 ABC transporter permease [Rhizobium sp. SEMIA 4032]UXT19493.1 ABC transporter permease [Agrobacterium tumefaciens]
MRATHALNGVGLLLVFWQAGTWLFSPPRYILPSPADVAGAFWRQPGFLFGQALVTLGEMALGLAAGIAAGILVAFTIAAIPRLGRLVWPMVLVLQAFPVFVLAPILVLWFGFGMASKVVMTAIIIFFPVASAFTDGLNRTDRAILDAASLTEASHWQILTRLRVPLALPSLISGLRVAAPLAPLGAVIGEWVGASAGLGFVMIQSNARMQTDTMFAAMAILAVMAVLLRLIVDGATANLAPWAKETEHTIPFRSLRRLSAP